jgi:protein-tyrosine-phosphatase
VSMKRLLVVCRYNQARSVVIGAVLRKLFPDIEFVTAGIQAPQGKVIPTVSSRLCHEWRLPNFDRISIAIDAIDVDVFDAVLAADDLVYEELEKRIAPEKLYSLLKFNNDERLIPIDPSGLNYSEFSREIAKAVIPALRWMNSFNHYVNPSIDSFMFEDEHSLQQWTATAEAQTYKVLVDTSISIPNASIWTSTDRQINYVDLRRNSWELAREAAKESNLVWMSKYEVDLVAEVFFSQLWLDFLGFASKQGTTALLAVAQQGGEKKAENLLGLVHSCSTVVVQ